MTYYILTSEGEGDPSEEFVEGDYTGQGGATRAYYEEEEALAQAMRLNGIRARKGRKPDIVVMPVTYKAGTSIKPPEEVA